MNVKLKYNLVDLITSDTKEYIESLEKKIKELELKNNTIEESLTRNSNSYKELKNKYEILSNVLAEYINNPKEKSSNIKFLVLFMKKVRDDNFDTVFYENILQSVKSFDKESDAMIEMNMFNNKLHELNSVGDEKVFAKMVEYIDSPESKEAFNTLKTICEGNLI